MSNEVKSDDPISDEELIRRFRATDESRWFAELFERHHRRIYSACRRFFDDGSEADAATQETFLRAFTAVKDLRDGKFSSWLTVIAKNACIDLWRQRRRELLFGGLQDLDSLPLPGGEPDQQLTTAADSVRREMELLPTDQRRCLEMKIAGYSYEETATSLGMSIMAVKSHLQNGRRTLWLRVRDRLR